VADSGKDATLDILATNSGDKAPTIIYATNEVGGYGALEAVKEKGLSDSIRIMTIDGSCNGVAEVYDGGFDANIIQQPGLMAQIGLDAVKAFLETGKAATGFTETPFGLAVKEQGYPYATLQTEAEDICWGVVDDGTSELSGVGTGAEPMVGSGGAGRVVCSIGHAALMVAIILASIV
jgi:ABC-type sugar transport system substrate-binding protein